MASGIDNSSTVGRDQQLKSINSLLAKIANREGGSLLFSGEPGIGKSHLLREASACAKALTIRAISLRCSEGDINEPFALFSRLGALLDIPEPASLNTDAARFLYGRKTLDALAHDPTIVLIDDLQWCDYLSSVALLHLFDYGTNLGVGFLVTTRLLEETNDSGTIANVRTLSRLMTHDQLVGLSKTETATLISLSTSTTITPRVQKSLQDLTNGNPFFLLEIARLDTDIKFLDEVKIPRELEGILDQRINSLGEQEEVIAMAALLGMRGERRILFLSLVNLGYEDSIVSSALTNAERLALLISHDNQYEFRHALYTQRLVSRMSYTQRSKFHKAAAIMFANETRYMAAMAHLVQCERTDDTSFGETVARAAFEISQSNGDHVGSTEAAQWLLDHTELSVSQRVNFLIQLAKSQIAIGLRIEGRKNAELAARLAGTINDTEAEANATMQWAARTDFTPDRIPVITAFGNIDASKLLPDTRIRFLSAYSQAVLLVPTEEYVSVTTGSELISSFGTDIAESTRADSTESAAWNWNINATLARKLAADARDEAEMHANLDISYEARVQALLAWREAHRSPAYLSERLTTTQQAIDLSRSQGDHNESVYFCHILDLMESGNFTQADLEIQHFYSTARAGGSFIAQWWSGFLQSGRLLSQGRFTEAGQSAQQVFERGQLADEPGRLVIMLEQQTLILIESIIPTSLSALFQGETALLANHYARALAALGNASLGNTDVATQLIKDTLSVLEDPDQEAAWLPTVTMLIETAHLLHLYDIAARGVELLEPYSRQHVTYIGNTIRGPVRRYFALAKHASGDTPKAIDDLLIARNESRRIGDHLWDLACSVDILEILATSDPARAIELVPESIIVEAEASEMKWRGHRGRLALTKARIVLAADLGLTPRQITVMHQLLQNLTINEIASSLGFSHSTVRQESIAIYKVLGISGRSHIADRARELMLL